MTQNALTQYLELYEHHSAALETPAPAVMNSRRRDAFSQLRAPGASLPHAGMEGFVFTDLNAMFSPDLGINVSRLPFRADLSAAFHCGVPNISTLTGVLANDMYAPTDLLRRNCPPGLTVCTFTDAVTRLPGVLERYYGRVAPGDNSAVQLNTLLAQDGVLIHVAAHARIAKPLQLISILGGMTTPLLAVRRILIVLEEDSALTLLGCDHSTEADTEQVSNTVMEISVDAGATLSFYDLQESDAATSRYASITAEVHRDATLNLTVATLRCGKTRNDVLIRLMEENASAKMYAMAITDGAQCVDNNTLIRHEAPHTQSVQNVRNIVRDNARAAFEGLIYMAPGAHHTSADQNNHNVLTDAGARMHTRPQLEIYCDDVRANHGAATGELDPRALFYMQTRGIPADQARTMLMQAFMSDIIDTISLEPLRDRIRHLTEARLADPADANLCATCAKN